MDERREIERALYLAEQFFSSKRREGNCSLTAPIIVDKFQLYWNELRRWNRKIRIVGDTEEFPIRHLADSLMALPLLYGDRLAILDFGSGGGFPGLPLAVILSEAQFFLAEPNNKKASFLRHLVRILSLDNVQIRTSFLRGDPKSEGLSETFDRLVFRAVEPRTVLSLAPRYLRDKGELLYWGLRGSPPIDTTCDNIFLIEALEYTLVGSRRFSIFRYKVRR